MKKTQLGQGQYRGEFWGATKTRRGCPRMWPQNRRGCKRAQLDQGLFVTTRVLESYEDAARLPYDVVTEQTRV